MMAPGETASHTPYTNAVGSNAEKLQARNNFRIMEKFNSQIEVKNDGLYTPIVREWSLEKYQLVGSYCDIFTNGMKFKWDQLVYIDLFAGAGHATIKESKKTYLNSAFTAMSIPVPFTKYILCEKDEKRFNALSERVKRDFSHLNVELIQ